MSPSNSKNFLFGSSESKSNFPYVNENSTNKFRLNKNNPFVDIPKTNLENIINQNLIITDEVIKMIIIGDKGVGKSLFVNKLCEIKNISQNYEPTQT